MASAKLERLIQSILCEGEHFLDGIHKPSNGFVELVDAVIDWARTMGREPSEIVSGVEPSVRQSILMTLLPAKALTPTFQGSYDLAISEHLGNLGISGSADAISVLRNVVINIRKLQGLSKDGARSMSASLATLRADTALYSTVYQRQGGRCVWCGIALSDKAVTVTLEHITPKHLGDDPPNGANWGLACLSCNEGKGDSFAWSANTLAHDSIERIDAVASDEITLRRRWIVLRRSASCSVCGSKTKTEELWAYKRISTGLTIPANCAVACRKCAALRKLLVLRVPWTRKEAARAQF
jgi:hypothetical protein